MNKTINETHPSLKGKQGYVLTNSTFVKEKTEAEYKTVFLPYDVQGNTIDKAVLKKLIDKHLVCGYVRTPVVQFIQDNVESVIY